MSDLTATNLPAQATISAETKFAARGDTRQKLLDAAWSLFISKGFHATRPQDISRAAGVGHGTFYLHFKDKQACFIAFAEKAAEVLEAYIEDHSEPDAEPRQAIRETIRLTYEFSQDHPGVLAAALTDMRVIGGEDSNYMLMGRWGALWSERLRLAQEAGAISPDVDTIVVGQAIPGMIRQAGEYATHGAIDMDRVVDALMAFLASGLGLKEGK